MFSILIYAAVIESLIIRLIKSRRVSLTVHVAKLEEIFVKCGETEIRHEEPTHSFSVS